MNFAFSEEQEELRRIVRSFLDDKSDEQAVRALMATEKGYDDAVWRQMADQMGLQGLIVPEDCGGSGFSYVELIVVLEEMGRSLLCAPYFSTVVLAANTLIHSGDGAAKKQHLPGIASGDTIATLAFTEDNGRWDESGITMVATASGGGWSLNGHKMYVLDGHVANLIIVAARTSKGVSLFTVDADAAGLSRTALQTMDQTRKQARLEFDNTPATLLGVDGDGWKVLERVLDLAAVALAAEQVGGAQKCLDMSVEYAGRSGASRPSSTSAQTCCSKSSRPSRRRTTQVGVRQSSTTNFRRSHLWRRRIAPRPTSTPRPKTSRSTVASASHGSTPRICTSNGRSPPSCCSVTPPTTASSSRSASVSNLPQRPRR